MDKSLVIPCSFPTLLCCISTHLGNAVDRDEIWVVFCHNLRREAFIGWRLEEIQNKGKLHTGHCRLEHLCSNKDQQYGTHTINWNSF